MVNMPDPLPADAVIPWSEVHPGIPEPAHPHYAQSGGGWFFHATPPVTHHDHGKKVQKPESTKNTNE